ncbi:MAG: hypothetical protein P1V35_17270 [Planctomycetota bacterium]|nr:hypothetical protein [Planctomycetota bacterium]
MKRTRTISAIAPQLLILPLLAWLVWSADLWTAISLMYPAYLVVAVISCGLLLLPCAFVRRPAVVVIPFLWAAFLIALPFMPNSSLKPLLWAVRDLEQGMGRETVLQTIHNHYVDTNFPRPLEIGEDQTDAGWPPGTTRLCLKPQGRSPGFQAESLLVFLVDGRFDRALFQAD